MLPIRHEMIMASAGAGKTYALVSRFVNLLLHDQSPENLVALTFSRKAAGEFFDKIFERLAGAITDEEKRKELEKQLAVGDGSIAVGTLVNALRKMAESMPRLRLGTLDSLFVQILQTFYLEFGFSSGFTLLSESQIEEERRRACEAVFRSAVEQESGRWFLEAFQSATFGAEEKSILAQLMRFIGEHYGDFLSGSDAAKWGGEQAIWPGGCEWLLPPVDPQQAGDALIAALEGDPAFDVSKRAIQARDALIKTAREFAEVTPERKLAKFPAMAKQLLEKAADLKTGTVSVKYYQEFPLGTDQCRHAYALVHHIMHCEITAAQQRTRGIWQILAAFDDAYQSDVRSAGKLTFDDVQRLLAGERPLSQQRADATGASEETLLHIGYRLDARFHHWMLDEFQDTSRIQWRVLQNLIDEVVTHGDSTERSLFYVGDVKQSIYGWRGGDHQLFGQIADHYNHGSEDVVHIVPRNTSWRCTQPVIDAVNKILGNTTVLTKFCGPEISSRWADVWSTHETTVNAQGHTTFLSTPRPPGNCSAPEQRHFAVALALIEHVDPLSRGLTCAVLVRRNPDGDKAASYIRQNSSFDVERDAESHTVTDNPLGSAFLSLFKAAGHPFDTFSWQHLQLTPFQLCLETLGWEQNTFVRETLNAIHRDGFEPVIRQWLTRLRDALDAESAPPDAFSACRAESLCDAAAEFDTRGSRDCTQFVTFLEGYTRRESTSAGRIQVMTVHKAKGLEFDMVIVLELGNDDFKSLGRGRSFAAAHEEEEVFHAAHDAGGSLRWAMDLPRESIATADPVLRQSIEERKNDRCYENLCLTYVAMTRAKHGLYLIADDLATKSTSFHFGRYLHETLAESEVNLTLGSRKARGTRRFETGDPEWFTKVKRTTAIDTSEPAVASIPSTALRAVTKPDLPILKPSSHTATSAPASSDQPGYAFLKYSLKSSDAMAFGTAVHALFELVPWLDDFPDEAAIRSHWNHSLCLDASTNARACDEVLACLRDPKIARLFRREAFGAAPLLWRERAFSQIVDGHLLSGVFDRVVITCDPGGKPRAATIIDFKTDKVSTPVEIDTASTAHQSQMNAYREALTRLLAMPTDQIDVSLVFTRACQVVPVPHSQA